MSMYEQPLLTIAIPTYNGAKTIGNMLDLLLPQVDERVEVLIVDNCSIDETPILIEKYKAHYPKIRVIRNEENIGPDRNFLKAYQSSHGKFILLLSDDDIFVENALPGVLAFLENHSDICLAFLETVGFHVQYHGVKHCLHPGKEIEESFTTTDKKRFMHYAAHYWGFMSSFICAKDRFDSIVSAEQFYGTYWLQSYIHILCSQGDDALLGVIKGPCIGAGTYMNVANFDTSLVDGQYYRAMLDFAIERAGYDKKQLNKMYIRRLCLLGKRAVMKERASGIRKTNVSRLFELTKKYPRAYWDLYPFLLIPSPICKVIFRSYRKYRKASGMVRINRPE